jgi:hypothetical protein
MKQRAGYLAAGAAGGAVAVILAEWVAVIAIIKRRLWS